MFLPLELPPSCRLLWTQTQMPWLWLDRSGLLPTNETLPPNRVVSGRWNVALTLLLSHIHWLLSGHAFTCTCTWCIYMYRRSKNIGSSYCLPFFPFKFFIYRISLISLHTLNISHPWIDRLLGTDRGKWIKARLWPRMRIQMCMSMNGSGLACVN